MKNILQSHIFLSYDKDLFIKLVSIFLVSIFNMKANAENLIICKKINHNHKEYLSCGNKSYYQKTTKQNTAHQSFLGGSIATKKIGENNPTEPKLCKIVHFDGVRNIFCDNHLYIEDFNKHFSAVENQEDQTLKRERKYILDATSPANSYWSIGVSK